MRAEAREERLMDIRHGVCRMFGPTCLEGAIVLHAPQGQVASRRPFGPPLTGATGDGRLGRRSAPEDGRIFDLSRG